MLCLCGTRVLSVGSPPVLLDLEPHPLGIYAPDGSKLKARVIVRAGAGHRGWRRHQCPVAEDDALALFKVVE